MADGLFGWVKSTMATALVALLPTHRIERWEVATYDIIFNFESLTVDVYAKGVQRVGRIILDDFPLGVAEFRAALNNLVELSKSKARIAIFVDVDRPGSTFDGTITRIEDSSGGVVLGPELRDAKRKDV